MSHPDTSPRSVTRYNESGAEAADGHLVFYEDYDELEGRLREKLADAYKLASGKTVHASDCATSNAPAMEPGPCDCSTPLPSTAAQTDRSMLEEVRDALVAYEAVGQMNLPILKKVHAHLSAVSHVAATSQMIGKNTTKEHDIPLADQSSISAERSAFPGVGMITAEPITTHEQLEAAYRVACRGKHISEIASVLALRNAALSALSAIAAPTDPDGARWRQAVKDGEFPRRGAGGFWLHVCRKSGAIIECDTPEAVMDIAIENATLDGGGVAK